MNGLGDNPWRQSRGEVKLLGEEFVKQVGFKLGMKQGGLWMSRVVNQKRKSNGMWLFLL